MKGFTYIATVNQQIQVAWQEQQTVITQVVDALCDTIQKKRSIYIFGCSHASILAQELFYRTGGLALINPIFYSGMMLDTKPVTLTSDTERLSGIGAMLLRQNKVQSGDLLIIHSVSGRNTVPVEMAIEARKLGVTVVCLTNMAYSNAVTSRHPSGKRLYEVSDLIIDNYGICGDGCITFDRFSQSTGPTSTVVGAALLNGIIVEVVENLLDAGINPPVFMSANLDGGDAYNAALFEQYKENIFYQ